MSKKGEERDVQTETTWADYSCTKIEVKDDFDYNYPVYDHWRGGEDSLQIIMANNNWHNNIHLGWINNEQ